MTAADDLALQLSNVVYGTARTSEGDTVATTQASGPPQLTISGLESQALTLEPARAPKSAAIATPSSASGSSPA